MKGHEGAVAAAPKDELWQARDCETHTGIPAATSRYWAHIGAKPQSFKLGRRRVWRQSVVEAWIAEQEQAAATGAA